MSIHHQEIKVKLSTRLPRLFYARDTVCVARELLGKRLVRFIHGQKLSGLIVETEAYYSSNDAASHAYRGPTPRNAPMFGPPGHAYVYFIYGMHWLFNIVAHEENAAGAILIRALTPEAGLDIMRVNRGGKPDRLLLNGPARLAQALAIDGEFNKVDLCNCNTLGLELAWDVPEAEIACGTRIRVPGDELAQARPWRFWIQDHPNLSS